MKKACQIAPTGSSTNLLMKTATTLLNLNYRRIGIHQQNTFIKGHRRTLFAQEAELMAFILVDLFAPGRFNGFKMHQVAGFTNQVTFV